MVKLIAIAWIAWAGMCSLRFCMMRGDKIWHVVLAIATLVAAPVGMAYAALFWKPRLSFGWPLITIETVLIIPCLAMRPAAILWYVRLYAEARRVYARRREAHPEQYREEENVSWAFPWAASGYARHWESSWGPAVFLVGEAAVPVLLWVTVLSPPVVAWMAGIKVG
jgi:hypothetical protein